MCDICHLKTIGTIVANFIHLVLQKSPKIKMHKCYVRRTGRPTNWPLVAMKGSLKRSLEKLLSFEGYVETHRRTVGQQDLKVGNKSKDSTNIFLSFILLCRVVSSLKENRYIIS